MASRVAKNPVKVPTGVDVAVNQRSIVVKGKLGELSQKLPGVISIEKSDDLLQVKAANDEQKTIALAGTVRALVQNMVKGVSEGFSKKLVLVGVGYRAKVQNNALDLTVGMSHPVIIPMPEGVTVETLSNTEILLKGADKHKVSQIAANIRAVRPPEPYKGKGIRYENEQVILKEGKKK